MSSTATLERPDTAALFDVPGDGSTLEALVLRVWEGLSSGESTACLVCGGALEPSGCRDCGASLE